MTYSYVVHDWFIYGTWLIYIWDMTHSSCLRLTFESDAWHDAFLCVTWLIHTWDMTRSYMGHDSFIMPTSDVRIIFKSCVCHDSWRIYMCDMTHASSLPVTFEPSCFVCDMTHASCLHLTVASPYLVGDVTQSYVWRVTWLIYMRNITHSHVWHDPFLCGTWLMYMCDMTYSYVWRDSFVCVAWLICMCAMTYTCVFHHAFIYMTWLI